LAVVPLEQTIKRVQQATDLIDNGKYCEASRVLPLAQADIRFLPPYRASAGWVVSEPSRARRLPIGKASAGDATLPGHGFLVAAVAHNAHEDAHVAVRDALRCQLEGHTRRQHGEVKTHAAPEQ
jgi:hypothetical protein